MSSESPNNNDLLKRIAVTVEEMRGQMATKEDLAALREGMATKDELASLREQMATKDEVNVLRNEISFIAGQVETIRDQMATKNDLARLEAKMDAGFVSVRGDVEQVQLRVDSIDRAVHGRVDRVESELSRVRSVLYLLVKDKPDMLRLLGQTPPPPGEEGRL